MYDILWVIYYLVSFTIRGILKAHPAVAGLRQRAHHPRVEITSFDNPLSSTGLFSLLVVDVESRTPAINQFWYVLGIKQRPILIVLYPTHEEIRYPIREVQIMCTACLIACVITKFEKLFDVCVPRLEVHSCCTLSLTAIMCQYCCSHIRFCSIYDKIVDG